MSPLSFMGIDIFEKILAFIYKGIRFPLFETILSSPLFLHNYHELSLLSDYSSNYFSLLYRLNM